MEKKMENTCNNCKHICQVVAGGLDFECYVDKCGKSCKDFDPYFHTEPPCFEPKNK